MTDEAHDPETGEVLPREKAADGGYLPRPARTFGEFIQIPVFLHGDAWRVAARLRYRKNNGSLAFWYDLWRIDRVFDAAFKEAITEAEEQTGCPLYLGAPETTAPSGSITR